jgi:SnoaL-like polyketide cyclase
MGITSVTTTCGIITTVCWRHADLHIEVQRRHASNDAVVVEAVITGHHLGAWRGLPPTGRPIRFPLCGIFAFDEDDRLAGEKIYYDRATVLRQLGDFSWARPRLRPHYNYNHAPADRGADNLAPRFCASESIGLLAEWAPWAQAGKIRNPHSGIVLNEFFEEDGDILFKHALRGHYLETAWVSVSVRAV